MMGMKLPPSSVKCIPNPCLFLKEFSWDSGIRNSFKFFISLENAHSFLFSKFSAQPKENQFEIQQITFTWKRVTMEHGVTQHCPSYGNVRFHKKWTVFQPWEKQCPKIKAKQSNASLRAKSSVPYFFTSSLPGFIFSGRRDSMHDKALTICWLFFRTSIHCSKPI